MLFATFLEDCDLFFLVMVSLLVNKAIANVKEGWSLSKAIKHHPLRKYSDNGGSRERTVQCRRNGTTR